MFKAKLVIPIVTVMILMPVINSYSQENTVKSSGLNKIQILKDQNPQKSSVKLYSSMQSQFEDVTIIKFELGEMANVLLTVQDSKGKIVEILIDDQMDAGVYNMNFKSADRIIAGEFTYKLEVKGVSGIKNVFAVK